VRSICLLQARIKDSQLIVCADVTCPCGVKAETHGSLFPTGVNRSATLALSFPFLCSILLAVELLRMGPRFDFGRLAQRRVTSSSISKSRMTWLLGNREQLVARPL
jgi:hypothetical protein